MGDCACRGPALSGIEAGKSTREFTKAFIVGKIREACTVLLDPERGLSLAPLMDRIATAPGIMCSDPFNIADSRVVSFVGQSVRFLLATYRFTKPEDLDAALAQAMAGARSKKAHWALGTMMKRPAPLPIGTTDAGSSDARVFACCWLWTDEARFLPDFGTNMKESLLHCFEDVVTDRMEWDLGCLCRVAHFCQALAGLDDDGLADFELGARTFQFE